MPSFHRRHHGRHNHHNSKEGNGQTSETTTSVPPPNPQTPATPSALSTALTVISLSLPPIFLLLALTFTCLAIQKPTFAAQNLYYVDAGTGQIPNVTNFRAPFWTCVSITGSQFEGGSRNQSCAKVPLGKTGYADCRAASDGNEHNCQQLELSRNSLLAGAVFVGLAFGLSLVVVGVDAFLVVKERATGVSGGNMETSTATLNTLTYILPAISHTAYLFTVLSVVLVFMGQILGVNSLVNDWLPNGDFISNTPAGRNDDVGPWYMGQAGLVFCTMGWAWGLAAAWLEGVTWVWGW